MKLAEIAELLEDIRDDNLVGGMAYVPAYFEWAVWRLFLALNNIEGAISETRGFQIDEDMQPRHPRSRRCSCISGSPMLTSAWCAR